MELDAKATILIVDGCADQLVLTEELLQEHWHVKLARNGADAQRVALQAPRPDLVLVASSLPDMAGVTLLRELKSNFLCVDRPVLLVAPAAALSEQIAALAAGCADVLTLPLLPEVARARVAGQLALRRAQALLKDQHSHFEHLVAQRTREVVELQDATILAMAALAESRVEDTANHIRRTQHYVQALARELRFHAAYTAELSDANIALLFKAAPLHDIGKVGVPDAILFKPGKLSAAEFEQMKLHTVYGRDAIAGVARSVGGESQFLRYASQIAYSHQEKWDGSGYPQGLAGAAIPLAARLMAVADVYDALISARTYRPAFTHETAVELIRQGSGEHFDPDVVDAMLAVEERFRAIAAEFHAD